jgi:hypothetical protein
MLWQRCSDQACALQKRLYHKLLYCHRIWLKACNPVAAIVARPGHDVIESNAVPQSRNSLQFAICSQLSRLDAT